MDIVDEDTLRKRAEIAASHYRKAADKVLTDSSYSAKLDPEERLNKIDDEKARKYAIFPIFSKADEHPPPEEEYSTLNKKAIQALKMMRFGEAKDEETIAKKPTDTSQILEEFKLQTEGGIALMKNSPMKDYFNESEVIYSEIKKSIRKFEISVLKSGKPINREIEDEIESLKHKAREIIFYVHNDFLRLEEIRVFIQHLLSMIGKELQI